MGRRFPLLVISCYITLLLNPSWPSTPVYPHPQPMWIPDFFLDHDNVHSFNIIFPTRWEWLLSTTLQNPRPEVPETGGTLREVQETSSTRVSTVSGPHLIEGTYTKGERKGLRRVGLPELLDLPPRIRSFLWSWKSSFYFLFRPCHPFRPQTGYLDPHLFLLVLWFDKTNRSTRLQLPEGPLRRSDNRHRYKRPVSVTDRRATEEQLQGTPPLCFRFCRSEGSRKSSVLGFRLCTSVPSCEGLLVECSRSPTPTAGAHISRFR